MKRNDFCEEHENGYENNGVQQHGQILKKNQEKQLFVHYDLLLHEYELLHFW
jgi:hypothetical protein